MKRKPLFTSFVALAVLAMACSLSNLIAATAPATPTTASLTGAPTDASAAPTPATIPAPTAIPTQSGPLPAPLYFLSAADEQVWRLEIDGSTVTAITQEPSPVTDFDVSPTDGSLAYLSGGELIRAAADGSNRTVLLQAQSLNASRWSPSGAQIAYGSMGGVYLIPAAGGASTLVQPPGPINPVMGTPERSYSPLAWVDEGRLLLQVGLPPEGRTLAFKHLGGGSLVELERVAMGTEALSLDGESVYFASTQVEFGGSGLWLGNGGTGAVTELIPTQSGGTYFLVAHPYQHSDGKLYFFMAAVPSMPGFEPLSMHRAEPDGVTGRVALRADSHLLGEALWAPDGSGAVIVDVQSNPNAFPPVGALVWLPSDGSAAVALPTSGHTLRWGK